MSRLHFYYFLSFRFSVFDLFCSLVKWLLSDILYSYLLISFRYRLSVGTNEKIQLSSLIAAFQVTRDLIVTEA